jgi:hypothetical protein
MPSSLRGRALVIDGERAAPVGDGAVIDHGHALGRDALAEQSGEGGGLLPIEVPLEAVADRLVEEDAGPAGAEHHRHLAGRRGHRGEVDQRLAQRLVDARLPVGRIDEPLVGKPAARAMAAGLLAAAVANHHGDVEPDQRPDVADANAVRAEDLHRLPFAGDRGHDLAHARVLAPRIGVDLRQERDFALETGVGERVDGVIETAVGADGRLGHRAGAALADGLDRLGGAVQGPLAELGGVGVALRLARDGAQPEALGGIVARALHAPVVEADRFREAVFQEELAVIRARQRLLDQPLGLVAVEARALEEQGIGLGKLAHAGHRRWFISR